MHPRALEILAEVRAMPEAERRELLAELAALDGERAPASQELEHAWLEEIVRRRSDVAGGRAHMLPLEAVLEAVQARHPQSR